MRYTAWAATVLDDERGLEQERRAARERRLPRRWRTPGFRLKRIVAGGQTGVDRAALDAALSLGFDCGGWCPKGRLAEDGPIAARYPLEETRSARTAERTRRNVADADATLVLSNGGAATGGTLLTIACAAALGRPYRIVNVRRPRLAALVRRWLIDRRVEVLNVAGPRASQAPDIYRAARAVIAELLKRS